MEELLQLILSIFWTTIQTDNNAEYYIRRIRSRDSIYDKITFQRYHFHWWHQTSFTMHDAHFAIDVNYQQQQQQPYDWCTHASSLVISTTTSLCEMHFQCVRMHSVFTRAVNLYVANVWLHFIFSNITQPLFPYMGWVHQAISVVYITITSHNQNVAHRRNWLVVRLVQHVVALIKSNGLYLCSKINNNHETK